MKTSIITIILLLCFISCYSKEYSKNNNLGELHLALINLSSVVDPVDLIIFMDNKKVIDKEFVYEDEGNNADVFEYKLQKGEHTLKIKSKKGGVTLEIIIHITEKPLALYIAHVKLKKERFSNILIRRARLPWAFD